MSRPADGQPRFVVTTVEGVRSTGGAGKSAPLGKAWIVLDRAECHRAVGEYRSEDTLRIKGGGRREQRFEQLPRIAAEHAERLNAEHAAP